MSALLRGMRRLWALATCPHVGAMQWDVMLPDVETSTGLVEMHFCRRCGRMLNAVREGDQPQYNSHWMERDQLDAPGDRGRVTPHDPYLRDLAKRYDRVKS